ncbi:P-loop NTPase fold protein [Leuconostoc mesenteroides]|uniref:P-loop NTPase fold protein n=1 Tax=Leuconostoc mesenteroides TaxID=1245 RepID=UPI0027303D1F|nr:P-loop NTPase fold protein [Leuconostoc mesenteroides]MDP0486821.1 P-loop NTPase fold protein [Leuconostoc mesenteroides]
MGESQFNKNFFEDEIDTNQSAKNFTKLLEGNQTIFLNGEWGTGKSTFLKNVEKHSIKFQKKAFVYMDLWRTDNSQSLITFAFRKLIPSYYWLTRLFIVFSIVISILMTGVIKIPFNFMVFNDLWNFIFNLFSYFNIVPILNFISIAVTYLFLPINFLGILLVLFVSVSQLLKINYFGFDALFFGKKVPKNKVLVIDDFDRLPEPKQKDAYKLLSLLNGKLPIIFVGSYDRITKDPENEIFLSKIIDRRVELPIVTWPSEIWATVFHFVNTKFGIILSEEFKEIFIKEQKNLRDRAHFLDYMHQELFVRNKLNHVQIEEQLAIIYSYLFHSRVYNRLLINKDHISVIMTELQGSKDPFEVMLSSLLTKNNNQYPVGFIRNPSIYYLFEIPTNLTTSEIELQLEDPNKLNQLLMSKSNSDFYNYIISYFHNLNKISQSKLFDTALNLFNNQNNSDVIKYLVSEKNQEILPYNKPISVGNGSFAYSVPDELVNKSDTEIWLIRYENWRKILESANFDISQQLKFFVTFSLSGFKRLSIYYKDVSSIVQSSIVNDYVSPEFILLEYISQLDQWYLFSQWEDAIWQYIDKLPDNSLLKFLEMQDVIKNTGNLSSKNYELMKSSLDFDTDLWRDNTLVIEKIKNKLERLANEDYNFTEINNR